MNGIFQIKNQILHVENLYRYFPDFDSGNNDNDEFHDISQVAETSVSSTY